ncbi:MAG: hypothetical protein QM699_11470 [Amaricoccus sp.]|uniref:spike base protein, RCAP_Rcc01079 family n=1 Tax=Amaricoccus sp. TaxID=1872485 RepID=UPI0039E32B8F
MAAAFGEIVPRDFVPVVPSDAEDNLPPGTIGLVNNTGADAFIAVVTAGGTSAVLPVVAYGALSGRFRRVKVDGTTAGEVLAAVW